MPRHHLPNRRGSETFNFKMDDGILYVATVSPFEDGRIGELFLNANKASSSADVNAKDAAIIFSIAVQYGTPAEVLRNALTRDPSGKASGPLGRALDILAAS